MGAYYLYAGVSAPAERLCDLFFGNEVVVSRNGILEHGRRRAEIQAALRVLLPALRGVDIGGEARLSELYLVLHSSTQNNEPV